MFIEYWLTWLCFHWNTLVSIHWILFSADSDSKIFLCIGNSCYSWVYANTIIIFNEKVFQLRPFLCLVTFNIFIHINICLLFGHHKSIWYGQKFDIETLLSTQKGRYGSTCKCLSRIAFLCCLYGCMPSCTRQG